MTSVIETLVIHPTATLVDEVDRHFRLALIYCYYYYYLVFFLSFFFLFSSSSSLFFFVFTTMNNFSREYFTAFMPLKHCWRMSIFSIEIKRERERGDNERMPITRPVFEITTGVCHCREMCRIRSMNMLFFSSIIVHELIRFHCLSLILIRLVLSLVFLLHLSCRCRLYALSQLGSTCKASANR
jgi:hypothetical protein